MNEPATWTVLVSEDFTRITITLGENLDQAGAPELLVAIRAAWGGGRCIVIECHGLSFLPMAVVQILASLRQRCRDCSVSFAVQGVQESVAVYLRLAGLASVLGS